jgi:hypothetical protein
MSRRPIKSGNDKPNNFIYLLAVLINGKMNNSIFSLLPAYCTGSLSRETGELKRVRGGCNERNK